MESTPKTNTIYIISKGRPQCLTARTLTDMDYPGEWFIVCGTNDDKLSEYREKWGPGRILVFDWYEEVKTTDLLDNFGVENMSSGAVPVRNATRRIAEERGEARHWQFDDDYQAFYTVKKILGQPAHVKLNGSEFERKLQMLADYAHNARLGNVGFAVSAETRPWHVLRAAKRVFNAHNMPTDEALFTRWRGRMNDDLINAIETYRLGKVEMAFKFMYMNMKDTQSEAGGNTDIYKAHGTVRKAAYAILIDPAAVKLVIKYGRYHHEVNWRSICPKIISEKFRSKEAGQTQKTVE